MELCLDLARIERDRHALDLNVVYEDEHVAVVWKDAGVMDEEMQAALIHAFPHAGVCVCARHWCVCGCVFGDGDACVRLCVCVRAWLGGSEACGDEHAAMVWKNDGVMDEEIQAALIHAFPETGVWVEVLLPT